MKKYLSMIIGWAVIIFFASTTFTMLIFSMTVPFVLIYLIICVIKYIRNKTSIKEIGIKLSIILVSYILMGVINLVRVEVVQNNANIAVERVKAYKAKNGKYPDESEINIPTKSYSNGYLYYNKVDDTNAVLFYISTSMMYATHHYNFKDNKWEYFGG